MSLSLPLRHAQSLDSVNQLEEVKEEDLVEEDLGEEESSIELKDIIE